MPARQHARVHKLEQTHLFDRIAVQRIGRQCKSSVFRILPSGPAQAKIAVALDCGLSDEEVSSLHHVTAINAHDPIQSAAYEDGYAPESTPLLTLCKTA